MNSTKSKASTIKRGVKGTKTLKVVLPFSKVETPRSKQSNELVVERSEKSKNNFDEALKILGVEKKLVVLLERINVEDYIQSQQKKSSQKEPRRKVQEKKVKVNVQKKLRLDTKLKTKGRKNSKSLNESGNHENVGESPHSRYDSTIATQIPSDVLETFGIMSPKRMSTPTRPASSCANLETPPPTSSECTSFNFAEHPFCTTASLYDCMMSTRTQLPDSSIDFGVNVVVPLDPATRNSNEEEETSMISVSSTSQLDPLETGLQTSNLKMELGTISTHCEFLYGLVERLYSKPPVWSLHELKIGNTSIRTIAPYAMRIGLAEDKFFPFVAPISRTSDKFCCLIFGALDQYLIAYGGHFIVGKDRLYDPSNKMPVRDVKLINQVLCRHHLGLLNIPNKTLIELNDYFPQSSHPSYTETQIGAVEIFMASINQIQLKEQVRYDLAKEQIKELCKISGKALPTQPSHTEQKPHIKLVTCLSEPRMDQVFYETNLPINSGSLKRILGYVHSPQSVHLRFHNFASLQSSCTTESELLSLYYAAYSIKGCMSFYRNVFVLGYEKDHFVIGVVEKKEFFIIATQRIYNRLIRPYPGMQSVSFAPEMLESINLPLGLSFEHTLTMLEARQIFRCSHKYEEEFQEIIQHLDIPGFYSVSPKSVDSPPFTSEMQHKIWLTETINSHFTEAFQNSLYRFPTCPTSSENPDLFTENVTKLWLHKLMRYINCIPEAVPLTNDPMQYSLADCLKINISDFTTYFLSVFGMTKEFTFQCLHLEADGTPSSVCLENLPVDQIGFHIDEVHTKPLFWDNDFPSKKIIFAPFTLAFHPQRNPPLGDACDYYKLRWARAIVERWSGDTSLPYTKLIDAVSDDPLLQANQTYALNLPNAPIKATSGKEQESLFKRSPKKRQRTPDDDSSNESKRQHHSEADE